MTEEVKHTPVSTQERDIENQILNLRNREEKQMDTVKCCISSFLIFFALIVSIFVVLDLYFALDSSYEACVTQAMPIAVNLREYLIVTGAIGIYGVGALIVSSCLVCNVKADTDMKPMEGIIVKVISILFKMFNFSWTFVGAFIFWKYSDKSLCSNSVYNYVYASLIIRFVGLFLEQISNKKEK